LIRLSGKKVIYLGSNVPTQSLINAVKEIACSNLLLFLVHRDSEVEIQTYLNDLYIHFKEKNVFVAGDQRLVSRLKKAKNACFLSSVENLEQELL
jgi:hypothetical protein